MNIGLISALVLVAVVIIMIVITLIQMMIRPMLHHAGVRKNERKNAEVFAKHEEGSEEPELHDNDDEHTQHAE